MCSSTIVEIFKTHVNDSDTADYILSKLADSFPDYEFNFDLSDCDRILRAEYTHVEINEVINVVKCLGFECVRIE